MSSGALAPVYKLSTRATRLALSSKGISAILTITGAASVVIATIIAKQIYTPEDFGVFAAIVTIIQMVWSFGCLGFNQSILRLIDPKSKRLEISNELLATSVAGVAAITIPCAWAMAAYFLPGSFWVMIPLVLFTQITMMASSLLRAWESYVSSQLTMQVWRYAVLTYVLIHLGLNIAASTAISLQSLNVLAFSLTIAVPSGILSIILIMMKGKPIAPSAETPRFGVLEYLNLSAGFFGSLFGIALMRNFDRLAVMQFFDIETLGNIFFVASLVCYPFFLVAGQITFFRMPHYRRNLSASDLNRDLMISTIASVVGVICILVLTIISNSFMSTYYPKYVMSIQLVTFYSLVGALCLIYSIYSAAFGAIGSATGIWRANLLNLVLIAMHFGVLFILTQTLSNMLIVMLSLWICRIVCFHFEVRYAVRAHKAQYSDLPTVM